MTHPFKVSSGYSYPLFNPDNLKTLVDNTVKKVLEIEKELHFDTIAFSGNSGAGLAYPVSYLTKYPLVLVRKDKENTHGQSVEGHWTTNISNYIIIDDFVESGATINRIIDNLNAYADLYEYLRPQCVGILLYRGMDTTVLTKLFPNIKIYIVD